MTKIKTIQRPPSEVLSRGLIREDLSDTHVVVIYDPRHVVDVFGTVVTLDPKECANATPDKRR